jgi:hypothetical protein
MMKTLPIGKAFQLIEPGPVVLVTTALSLRGTEIPLGEGSQSPSPSGRGVGVRENAGHISHATRYLQANCGF